MLLFCFNCLFLNNNSELPNYEKIIPALIQDGIEKLPQTCSITPGIPLKPMLAHPTKSIASIFERFEGNSFTCEFKYDGERNQVDLFCCQHTNQNSVAILNHWFLVFFRFTEPLKARS